MSTFLIRFIIAIVIVMVIAKSVDQTIQIKHGTLSSVEEWTICEIENTI
jgi:hypothetical protein